jgi:PAS domain S-box-containing protein
MKQKSSQFQNSDGQSDEKILLQLTEKLAETGTWELNLKTGKLYWSDGVYQMLGYEPQSLTLDRENGFKYIHPDDRDKAADHLNQVIKNGIDYNIDKRLITSTGDIKHIVSKAVLLADEEGEPVKLTGVFKDISEQIYTKINLTDSQSFLNQIIQSVNGILWEADAETFKFSYISSQVTSILGYTPEEWLSDPNFWQNHIHPDDRESAIRYCHSESVQGRNHSFEYRMITSGGDIVWLHDIVTVIRREGKSSLLRGFMFDISDKKQSEQLLEKSEKRFKALVQEGSDLTAILDQKGNFLYISPNYSQFLDYHQSDLPGENAFDFVHPDDLGFLKDEYEALLSTDRIKSSPYRFRHKSGGWRWLQSTGTNLLDDESINGIVINSIDITESRISEIQNQIKSRIAQFFKEDYSLAKTLDEVLKYLTDFDEFSVAEIWLSSHTGKHLNLTSVVYNGSEKQVYAKATRELRLFRPGEGLPGDVWIKQKVQIRDDIQTADKFVRKDAARKAGLNSALGIPLLNSDEVIGILMLSGEKRLSSPDKQPEVYDPLGNFLGAEIRRKKQQEEMNLLFQSAPDILAIASPDGYFTKVNPAFCKLLGYTREELTTQPFKNFVHPDDLNPTEAEFDITSSGERHASNFVNRYKTKSGTYRWISWNSSHPFGDDGLLFAYGRDITKVKELQELLDNASRLTKVGGWEIDLVNNQLYWSKITRDIFEVDEKYDPNNTKGYEFFFGKNGQIIKDSVHKLIEEGVEYDTELQIKTAKKNLRWIRAIGKSERVDGQCLKIYGSIQDIHDKKSAERELQKAIERFEKVTEATNDAIWDYDTATDKLFWGVGFQTLFGYDPETTTPSFEFLVSLIHPDDRPQIVQKIDQFMRDPGKTHWHEEYQFLKNDGTYAYVIDRAIFIRDIHGDVIRVVGAMTDISYRKDYEEALKDLNEKLEMHARELTASNEELEQFAYIVSHDLQEPLRMISSFLQLLEEKYEGQLDEKAKQYIHFAVDGSTKMRKIIMDLLEFSRVGRNDDKIMDVDLHEIVNEVTLLQRRIIEEKNAEIEVGNLPSIHTFRTPVLQVFQNLIENALKFSNKNSAPYIKIDCADAGDMWHFMIKDNGIGIKEEHLEKVFIIFHRFHTENQHSGSGVGLAIVKKIIEKLGGQIWVESIYGEESTFHFTLPK